MREGLRAAAFAALISAVPVPALAGRTVYIPPVFSNKDWSCPQGVKITSLPVCYDFSLTNLSPVAQAVTVTAKKSGTMINGRGLISGSQTMASDQSLLMSFSGAVGESKQAAFCILCNSSGCNWGWTTTVGGTGTLSYPGPGGGSSGTVTVDGVTSEWFYYHSEVNFVVNIAEDRGALVGRLNQRLFPDDALKVSTCNDHWTSPPVVVELNGGRAF